MIGRITCRALAVAFLSTISAWGATTLAEVPVGPKLAMAMSSDCASSTKAVQQLARIVNTRDDGFHCLGVSVDGAANIIGIRFESHAVEVEGPSRRPVLRDAGIREFALSEIASPAGAVLDGSPGHDAVILQGRIPGAAAAHLVVKYLYNGITNEYRKCDVTLDRGERLNWRLLGTERRDVTLIVVKTWALPIIGTVGIETLEGLCADA